jgi:RNA polymerase sporulation-specific sigma factor
MSQGAVKTQMKTCAEILRCPPQEYINCPVFQRNSKCWLKGKGCLCTKDQGLECVHCSIYGEHAAEIQEILSRARQSDKEAFDVIIKEYSSFIHTIGGRFFLPGGSSEDIFQEGLIGLHEAVSKFDPSISHSFEKYASFCIRNSILASLKKATQKKQKILNESASIQGTATESGESNLLVEENFEGSLVLRLVLENFLNTTEGSLSAVEYKVLIAKVAGYATDEIIDMFKLTKKQVENAIFRARNKLKEILVED